MDPTGNQDGQKPAGKEVADFSLIHSESSKILTMLQGSPSALQPATTPQSKEEDDQIDPAAFLLQSSLLLS